MRAGMNVLIPRVLRVPTIVLLTLMVVDIFADESVHIRSKYGQMVTSSTLRWINGEKGSKPEDAVLGSIEKKVKKTEDETHDNGADKNGADNNGDDEMDYDEIEDEDVFVCRARHNGAWVPGRLGANSKACHVSLLGHVFAYDRYEVLQNEEGGARLNWVHWDRYNIVPEGAVGGGDSSLYYVARRATTVPGISKRSHYVVGKLDTTEGMGRISVAERPQDGDESSSRIGGGRRAAQEVTDEVERHYTDGQVLVETEPQSYELSGLKFNRWRNKVRRTPVVLAKGQLRNEASTPEPDAEDEASLVDTVLTYVAEYSVYWGQGRAMLKGLPTAVVDKGDEDKGVGKDKGVETFKWGLPETGSKQEVRRVEQRLLPGTAANVTLVANKTEIETPYTGQLVAYYADGTKTSRTVIGSRRRQELKDIQVVIGPAFFLNDLSLVPTTTTTTTTTTTPPTTSPASTTTEDLPPPPPPEPAQSKKAHSMLSDEQSVVKDWNGEPRREMKLASPEGDLSSGAVRTSGALVLLIATSIMLALHELHRT